jgi:hypothetical protein
MAVVILGRLATSTALNLLVLPTLAYRFGRFSNSTMTPLASWSQPTRPRFWPHSSAVRYGTGSMIDLRGS